MREDPIRNLTLQPANFRVLGRRIKELNLPILIVQEGGYNPLSNAECADNFIRGLTSK